MVSFLQTLTRLGKVIFSFVAHGFEQLFFNLFAFVTIHFYILAPLRHVVLVVARLKMALEEKYETSIGETTRRLD